MCKSNHPLLLTIPRHRIHNGTRRTTILLHNCQPLLTTVNTLCPNLPHPPLALYSLTEATRQIDEKGALTVFVNSYTRLITAARYARREPDEADAAACEKIVEVVLLT